MASRSGTWLVGLLLALLILPAPAAARRPSRTPPSVELRASLHEIPLVVSRDGARLASLRVQPDTARGFHSEDLVVRDLRTGRAESTRALVPKASLAALRRAGELEIWRADRDRRLQDELRALRRAGFVDPRAVSIAAQGDGFRLPAGAGRFMMCHFTHDRASSRIDCSLGDGPRHTLAHVAPLGKPARTRRDAASMLVSTPEAAWLLPGGRALLQLTSSEPANPAHARQTRILVLDLRPMLGSGDVAAW